MPEACKLLLETIENVRIANCIAPHEHHLRQIACLQQVGSLLGDVDGVLEHLELRAIANGLFYIELWFKLYHGDVVVLLVLKRYRLVEGESAKLVEQHAREHQAIVNLGECHLGLVHLHIYTESVATGSYALFYHLVDIAIELLNQLEIALGQLLLVVERYHLPVSLIYLIKRGMTTHICRILSQLLANFSYPVERHNATTHKQWLSKHNGTSKDVTGISTESIYNLLSFLIERTCCLGQRLTNHLLSLGLHLSNERTKTLLHAGSETGAKTTKSSLLNIAKNRQFFTGILVSTYRTHVRQILGAGRLTKVSGHILFKFGNA